MGRKTGIGQRTCRGKHGTARRQAEPGSETARGAGPDGSWRSVASRPLLWRLSFTGLPRQTHQGPSTARVLQRFRHKMQFLHSPVYFRAVQSANHCRFIRFQSRFQHSSQAASHTATAAMRRAVEREGRYLRRLPLSLSVPPERKRSSISRRSQGFQHQSSIFCDTVL